MAIGLATALTAWPASPARRRRRPSQVKRATAETRDLAPEQVTRRLSCWKSWVALVLANTLRTELGAAWEHQCMWWIVAHRCGIEPILDATAVHCGAIRVNCSCAMPVSAMQLNRFVALAHRQFLLMVLLNKCGA